MRLKDKITGELVRAHDTVTHMDGMKIRINTWVSKSDGMNDGLVYGYDARYPGQQAHFDAWRASELGLEWVE